MLTLEEQERLAYIAGRTEEATLLAALIDAREDAYDEGYNDGRLDEEAGRARA